MPTSKKLSEWEKDKGLIVKPPVNDTTMTEAEFDEISMDDKVPVAYEDRVKFLEDNGYAVTRENMIDVQLSARQLNS